MLSRFEQVMKNLVVFPDKMLENLELTRGTIFSGHLLLALVDKGMVREEAYSVVQKHAIAAFDGGASLEERVRADPAISAQISEAELARVFDLSVHLKQVGSIIDRALSQSM